MKDFIYKFNVFDKHRHFLFFLDLTLVVCELQKHGHFLQSAKHIIVCNILSLSLKPVWSAVIFLISDIGN